MEIYESSLALKEPPEGREVILQRNVVKLMLRRDHMKKIWLPP